MIDPKVPRLAHQVASRALSWLHANRELGSLPPDVTIDLADPDNAYKPLGEAALAASLVLRENVAGPRETQLARELMEFAWQQLREGDLLYERQLRHCLLTDPLETYAHFTRAGYRHARMDRLLAEIVKLRAVQAVESVPNRKLAVANARRVVGLDHESDWADLADRTWLGATPEPWAIDWMTGYDVTHTVFHLTDWGGRPEGLPARMRDYVRTWLPVWVDAWQEVGQWDLMAELLIVDSATGAPVCGSSAWEQLAAVQRADGLTPRDADPVEGDAERVYKDHQHPAIVAVIAGTVALSRSLDAGAAPAPA